MGNDKIHSLPNKDHDELLAAFEKDRRKINAVIGFTADIAKLKRAQYLSYVAQGFTEAQALELCKG